MTPKQFGGAAIAVASGLAVALGNLAPDKLAGLEFGYTMFLARKLLPEIAVIFVIGVWLYLSEVEIKSLVLTPISLVREYYQMGRSVKGRSRVAFGALSVFFVAAIGSVFYEVYLYGRARYAYVFAGYAVGDYKAQQIAKSRDFEARREFLEAATVFQRLREEFKLDQDRAYWLKRENLNRQIAAYAAQTAQTAQALENRLGLSRPAVLMYAEAVRVNPNDSVARSRLTALMETLNGKLEGARPAVAACLDTANSGSDVSTAWREAEPILFEQEVIEAAKRKYGSSSYSPRLCDSIRQIGSPDDVLRAAATSWQQAAIVGLLKQQSVVSP